MVAPLPPHYMHRAERRSMSLEASVPQRMIHGASAVGTRCTQRAQIISEGGDGCRGLPAHERRMGLFAPTGKPPRLVAPLAISLAPGRRLDLAPVATLAGAVGSFAAFAHNTFQAPLLGHAQQRQPVVKGFGQRDRWAAETFEEDLQALLAPFAHTATMLAGPNVT